MPAGAPAIAGDGHDDPDATAAPALAELQDLADRSDSGERKLVGLPDADAGGDARVGTLSAAGSGDASIAGTVRAASGEALSGICAAALRAHPLTEGGVVALTLTDASGRYVLEALPAGVYRLMFVDCNQVETYAYAYWPDNSSFAAAAPIEVQPGARLTGRDVTLALGAIVTGQAVEGGAGGPAPGVCAAILDDDYVLIEAALTDHSGRYTLRGLQAGDHYLVFIDCNATPAYAWDWWNGKASPATADVLRLSTAQHRAGIDGRMVVAGRVTGRVVDQDHRQPVADVCAAVFDASGDLLAVALTGDDGAYRTDGLRPGSVRMLFVDCGEIGRYLEVWYDGRTSLETADPVTIQAGGTTGGIDAMLPSGSQEPGDVPEPGDFDDVPPGPGEAATACEGRAVPSAGFADTAGSTHEAAIDCIVWHRLAQGTSATTYSPRATVTRAQMATFIASAIEAVGAALPAGRGQFTDVAGNAHQDNIERLAAAGIVQGVGGARYAPRATVTRAQMATFLARAFEFVDGSALPIASPAFTDIAGNAHEGNIRRVAGAGFAQGTTPTTYAPASSVRRDQMASFLARMLERFAADGAVLSGSVQGGDQVTTAATFFPPRQSCADNQVSVIAGVRTGPGGGSAAYRVHVYWWDGHRWRYTRSGPTRYLHPNVAVLGNFDGDEFFPGLPLNYSYASVVERWRFTYFGWQKLPYSTTNWCTLRPRWG